MNIRYISALPILFFVLNSCAEHSLKKNKILLDKKYFSSTGFALIYEDKLFNDKVIKKKIDNTKPILLHNFLKKNTPVRIINMNNLKAFDTKVYAKIDYPKIFNVLISKEIALILEIDNDNPYVEILEIKKNKKFIAKESNTFDEEKIVAEKVPVNKIKIDDITLVKSEEKKAKNIKTSFFIFISDFYYKESAFNLKKNLVSKISESNFFVEKISNKKYRLLVGPFKNFNALKTTYISLNNLGFEQLNIYRK